MKISKEINQTKFDNVYLKAFINVLFTGNYLRYEQQQTLKPYGITLQQFNVLKILKGAQPKSMQAKEIKKVMIDKSPDLTRLINRMIKNKWVNRSKSKTSGREVAISITQGGIDILAKTNMPVLKNVGLLNNLSESEAELLSNLLDKVRN
jgi:DNA-binding MarR family transcriptional regulator